MAEKIGYPVKHFLLKCQTSKLEFKNCKQGTPYARPSPAIAGISGVHSNFIRPFWSCLITKKKNRKPALLPTKNAVTNFPSTKFNWCCGQINWISFEHHTCILYSSCNHHVRIYCDCIGWNNHTWIINWIWVSDWTDRKLIALECSRVVTRLLSSYCYQ